MKGDVSIWRLGPRGETEAACGMVPIAIYSQGLMPCWVVWLLPSHSHTRTLTGPTSQGWDIKQLMLLTRARVARTRDIVLGSRDRKSRPCSQQLVAARAPGTRASFGLSLGSSAHLRDEGALRYWLPGKLLMLHSGQNANTSSVCLSVCRGL